jgi:hypothetical protein
VESVADQAHIRFQLAAAILEQRALADRLRAVCPGCDVDRFFLP